MNTQNSNLFLPSGDLWTRLNRNFARLEEKSIRKCLSTSEGTQEMAR